MRLQGPHHSAQKSTSTGRGDCRTSAEKLVSVNTFTFSEAMGSRRSLRIAVLRTIIAHKPVRTPALVVPTFSEMPAGVVPGYSEAIQWLKRPVFRSVPNRAT